MGLRDHHEPPDLTPREHPAPNTPQKWLHLSEEAANSFRNDWKEHFILLGFQQWEHDSRWED